MMTDYGDDLLMTLAERVELEKSKRVIEKLREDIRHYRELASIRGARMQVMKEHMGRECWERLKVKKPEAEKWFDGNGVPK